MNFSLTYYIFKRSLTIPSRLLKLLVMIIIVTHIISQDKKGRIRNIISTAIDLFKQSIRWSHNSNSRATITRKWLIISGKMRSILSLKEEDITHLRVWKFTDFLTLNINPFIKETKYKLTAKILLMLEVMRTLRKKLISYSLVLTFT